MLHLSINEKDIALAEQHMLGTVQQLDPLIVLMDNGVLFVFGGDPGVDVVPGQRVCFVKPFLN